MTPCSRSGTNGFGVVHLGNSLHSERFAIDDTFDKRRHAIVVGFCFFNDPAYRRHVEVFDASTQRTSPAAGNSRSHGALTSSAKTA